MQTPEPNEDSANGGKSVVVGSPQQALQQPPSVQEGLCVGLALPKQENPLQRKRERDASGIPAGLPVLKAEQYSCFTKFPFCLN